MSAPSLPNEEELFSRAADLPAAERAACLDQACAGDVALRARIEALLRGNDAARSFMESPPAADLVHAVKRGAVLPADLSAIGLATAEASVGDRIGRYKLQQKLGEGGCGVVYLAEQEEPVRRRVALKVIKLGMDTKEVVARFEAERQALAMMDHPNIARVLDAGATESGRPFFVMELVHGVPITKFCDEQNLPTTGRLEIFMQVCHAVQHAHQKGIIHRDLKPSNILVTLHDGVPVPKVIDFGIAKATQGRLTDATLFTAFEQFIGTPAYMSPEQAELSGLDIDTRSDIYSLGVLLYELLTGRTPFDAKSLVAAGLDEIRRIIREVEPPRPSTRLSTLADADRSTIAKHRATAPAQLSTLLRGDLDWIVMKSLEKDRVRRYESASAFAADIVRHLENEAVVARPASVSYRLGRTIRRNRLAFAAGGVIALALVSAFAIATRSYLQERSARHLAETQARKSAQVARFLQDMLEGVGPFVALGRNTAMLREILDQTDRSLQRGLEGQPEVEIELRDTLGFVYRDLGELEKAESMHREALSLRRLILGGAHPEVAGSLRLVGDILRRRADFPASETKLREAWSIVAEKRRAPPALRRAIADACAQLYADWAKTDATRAPAAAEWKQRVATLGPKP